MEFYLYTKKEKDKGFIIICPECKQENFVYNAQAEIIMSKNNKLICCECNKKNNWKKFLVKSD